MELTDPRADRHLAGGLRASHRTNTGRGTRPGVLKGQAEERRKAGPPAIAAVPAAVADV